MSASNPTGGRKELDRLVRGQARIETVLEEVRSRMDTLPNILCRSLERQAMDVGMVEFARQELEMNNHTEAEMPPRRFSQVTETLSVVSPNANDIELPKGVQPTASAGHQFAVPAFPHDVFHEVYQGLQRTDYAQAKVLANLGKEEGAVRSTKSTQHRGKKSDLQSMWSRLLQVFPFHPTSHGRIAFDCLGTAILMYDSVMVPIIIAYDMEYDGWLLPLGFVLACFWSLDMILNFCTGFSEGGKVVRELRLIVKKYLRGLFAIDLLVLSLDVMELVLAAMVGSNDSSQSLRFLKFVRLMKITRLVRIFAKLRMGLQTQIDAIWYYKVHVYGLQSYAQYLRLAGMLMKLLMLIAWLSHLGSCIWYFLGRSLTGDSGTARTTWYSDLDPSESDFEDYVRGLYWTLSTMFSGSSFVAPHATWEAAFAGVWVILGAIFVTTITSNLAAILIEAGEVQQDMKKKDKALTAFMEQRNTPVLLALAVRADFHAKISAAPRLTEIDLPFLTLLSPGLRSALREAQYRKHILALPIFRIMHGWGDDEGPVIQELCNLASTLSVVQPGEEVFAPHLLMEHCILMAEGQLKYTLASATMPPTVANGRPANVDRVGSEDTGEPVGASLGIVRFGDPTIVREGSWICELALYMVWSTVGLMQATVKSELLLVSVDAFLKLVAVSPTLVSVVSTYATAANAALQPGHQPGKAIKPTDIDPGLDAHVLVSNLHWTIRQLMSMPLLADLYALQGSLIGLARRKSLGALEEEVLSGKCYLVRNPALNITRIVKLSVLHLLNADGLLLVQIGAWRDGACVGKHQLPATKTNGSETAAEGIEKLLQQDFAELAPQIRLEATETVLERALSASYLIPTTYVKVVQWAKLAGRTTLNDLDITDTRTPVATMSLSAFTTAQRPQTPTTPMGTNLMGRDGIQSRTFAVGDSSTDPKSASLYTWMSPDDFKQEEWGGSTPVLDTWVTRLNAAQIRSLCQFSVRIPRREDVNASHMTSETTVLEV
mmetsp:Transcript_60841/g.137110  ORF Transcript_60841/g.137110 Transcript_60841/m.137110 type:complete len:1000 (+) Transcript_60841:120-3119(+)